MNLKDNINNVLFLGEEMFDSEKYRDAFYCLKIDFVNF